MSAFPATRLRRLRRTDALRSLVRETRLDLDDFVMPYFAGPSTILNEELPGMSRYAVEDLVAEAAELVGLGGKAVLLFGVPEEKDDEGSGAYAADGIVQRALRSLRERYPDLVLVTDVCLCEYTSHGHCGVIANGEVANDASVELLARTAVSHVEAGADVVAPSDMMDGRIGAIREALDSAGFDQTGIISYAAKFASVFYGPFRDAAESPPQFGDRRSYQMDIANANEALREVALDVDEGADIVMVKPALPYLDILWRVHERFGKPTAVYHVSGEYAMVKAASEKGLFDERAAVLEIMTALKRAGADVIVTYWARELATWLRE